MHSDTISWDGIEEHAEILHDYLARRCRDLNQADDLMQETLVRAARFRQRVQDVRSLRAWILRIGSSVLRDHQRQERRRHTYDCGDELLAGREARDPEPGQWDEEELLCLEGFAVERSQLMAEVDLALEEAEERDRSAFARLYGAGTYGEAETCRESSEDEGAALPCAARRKERMWRARQRIYRRLISRVRCVVRCGDEFAPTRLAATCTGGGAFALPPEEDLSGALRAHRGYP
ncbi:MAG: RNA polymerase sigma factor [Planctomycetes bacterium]|nr:RNA polymerase sigma factor [Planctomycetota bacterium]